MKVNFFKSFSYLGLFFAWDKITKLVATSFFRDSVVINRGSLFGLDLLTSNGFLENLVFFLLIIGLFLRDLKGNLGYRLIVLGGFCNLTDRRIWGGVVDFIHFPYISAFNLADVMITIGIY
ncbi:signal peptidase II, partial [candidate division WWE3 bacterium]|nr:signal peptidase II [candidate division WWE3 bacterium]